MRVPVHDAAEGGLAHSLAGSLARATTVVHASGCSRREREKRAGTIAVAVLDRRWSEAMEAATCVGGMDAVVVALAGLSHSGAGVGPFVSLLQPPSRAAMPPPFEVCLAPPAAARRKCAVMLHRSASHSTADGRDGMGWDGLFALLHPANLDSPAGALDSESRRSASAALSSSLAA